MKIFFYIFCFLFIFSCQKDTTVKKYIYNFSSDTLTINSQNEVYTIYPNTHRLVQTKIYEGLGKSVPCEQDHEFNIHFSSGRILVKSLDSAEAWEGNIDGANNFFQECYFEINEIDLQ